MPTPKKRPSLLLGTEVGSGNYGTVFKARRSSSPVSSSSPGSPITSPVDVAAKVMPLGPSSDTEIANFQKCVGIDGVVRLVDIIRTATHVYLALEFFPGGDLMRFVEENGPMEERKAMFVARQLLQTVDALHNTVRLVHRDIKPQNVLVDATDDSGNLRVKLCDLHFAHPVPDSDTELVDIVGDLEFGSPQLREKFVCCDSAMTAHKVATSRSELMANDVYCVGTTLYVLLTGSMPFPDKGDPKAPRDVPRVPRRFGLTDPAVEVLEALMQPTVAARPSASGALSMPWFDATPDSSTSSGRGMGALHQFPGDMDNESAGVASPPPMNG